MGVCLHSESTNKVGTLFITTLAILCVIIVLRLKIGDYYGKRTTN